ncbi:MAG TPA: nitroreductase family protein [Flavipsychrobacter sp.]|nr:nitroreductase family protein [Flavipsychrobacter sp.]
MSLLEALNWRYATKRMNGKQVPDEKVNTIIEAARLAPSNAGLQPFSIIVVKDKELLKKIQPIANNQPQIAEASHLLVFAAWDNITEDRIREAINHITNERNLPKNALNEFRDRIITMYANRTAEENFQSAARQAYIAFGVAITAAATEQVDATPMEGFNNVQLDEFLGLKEKGLRSVTLLPLGYRDEQNDWLANQKKVRWPKEKMIIELN